MAGGEMISLFWPVTLAAGVLMFLTLLGFGLAALRAVRLELPRPWNGVGALAVGVGGVSLVVQVLAMLALATPLTLGGTLLLAGLVAATQVRSVARLMARPTSQDAHPLVTRLLAGGLLVALLILLLIAVAPSTKHDEIFYHMLVPSRIVHDGELRFYRLPWEAAVLPQMVYPIITTPLHALGVPHASNVLSWCFAAALVWMVGCLVVDRTRHRAWAMLLGLVMTAGLYPLVYYASAGSHSAADLFSCALVLVLIDARRLRNSIGESQLALLIGLLLPAVAGMKASLVPLAGLVLLIAAWQLMSKPATPRLDLLARLVLPGVVLYLPLVVWTWWASGSPFGPILAGVFGESVYGGMPIRAMMRQAFTDNLAGLPDLLRSIVLHSPVLWLGAVAFLVMPGVPRSSRLVAVILFVAQAVLVWFFLTRSTRFMGGVPHALCVGAVLTLLDRDASSPIFKRMTHVVLPLTLAMPYAGYLVGEVIYARPFVTVLGGRASAERFARERVGLYEVWRDLDTLLPRQAVVLVDLPLRPSLAYSPRTAVMCVEDVPPGRETYVLVVDVHGPTPDYLRPVLPPLGEPIRVWLDVPVEVYRTPGVVALRGDARLHRLPPTPPLPDTPSDASPPDMPSHSDHNSQ